MTQCTRFQRMIESFVADELSPDEEKQLFDHAKDCRECKALLDLHSKLLENGEEIPEPNDFALQNMRDEVLARIAAGPSAQNRQNFWQATANFFRAHPAPAALCLTLLIAAAFFAGSRGGQSNSLDETVLLKAMQQQAAQQQNLNDYWDSPLSYSNVDARRTSDGRLTLSFDVSRHFDLETTVDSPLAKDILLHAILDPAQMGTRLRAMTLSPASRDTRLEAALIFALHNDPSEAIRLKALSVLQQYPYSTAIQEALLGTLQKDPAVSLRLLALDVLAGRQVPNNTVRQAIQAGQQESDGAVLQHARELIREF